MNSVTVMLIVGSLSFLAVTSLFSWKLTNMRITRKLQRGLYSHSKACLELKAAE